MGRYPFLPQGQNRIASPACLRFSAGYSFQIGNLYRQPHRRSGKQSPSRDGRQTSAIVGISHDPSSLTTWLWSGCTWCCEHLVQPQFHLMPPTATISKAQAPETEVNSFIPRERKTFNLKSNEMKTITGAQIRAARALIRWSAEDLAGAAVVGISTIRRAEAEDTTPSITAANLRAIQTALESAGIEFIPESDDRGAGVRMAKASDT